MALCVATEETDGMALCVATEEGYRMALCVQRQRKGMEWHSLCTLVFDHDVPMLNSSFNISKFSFYRSKQRNQRGCEICRFYHIFLKMIEFTRYLEK